MKPKHQQHIYNGNLSQSFITSLMGCSRSSSSAVMIACCNDGDGAIARRKITRFYSPALFLPPKCVLFQQQTMSTTTTTLLEHHQQISPSQHIAFPDYSSASPAVAATETNKEPSFIAPISLGQWSPLLL